MVFFCSGFSMMLFYTLRDLQVSQYVVSKAVLLFRFLYVTCCSVLCNWSSAIPSPEKQLPIMVPLCYAPAMIWRTAYSPTCPCVSICVCWCVQESCPVHTFIIHHAW